MRPGEREFKTKDIETSANTLQKLMKITLHQIIRHENLKEIQLKYLLKHSNNNKSSQRHT